MNLSIVIPVHNESDNLAPLIAEITAALGTRLEYEILVVNDGSTDDSFHTLSALQKEHAQLQVLHHARRSGQSAAVMTGVQAARARRIVTLDGDGQNPPAEIPRLFAAWQSSNGTVLVAGIRRRRHDGIVRRWSSTVANRVRSRLLGDDCPDTGCGLKMFDRDAFLSLPRFDHMHRFLPALFRHAGYQVVFVDVAHRPRQRGRSKYGVLDRLWVGIADIAGVMWLSRRSCRAFVEEVRHE